MTHDTISEAQRAAEERKARLDVPFPIAGEGVHFRFTLGSQAAFETALEEIEPGFRPGETFFGKAERLLLSGNLATVRAAVDCGLKIIGEDGKRRPFTDIDLDDMPWPVADVVEPALEALAFAHLGRGYKELIAEAIAARQAEQTERQEKSA